jgi:Na+/melibiose symporter-like transporter
MKSLIEEDQKENEEGDYKKLNKRLEALLDQFENEVKSYDKWSSISMLAAPVGIIISIFLPILFIQYMSHGNLYVSINSRPALYLVFIGIAATVVITKLAIFYVDYKKHEISRTKYRPIAGVCMCDLSQLRTHMIKIEKSKTAGERMRHVRLMNHYKHQMGWI